MNEVRPCYYVIERKQKILWVGHTIDLDHQINLHHCYEKFSRDMLHRNLKNSRWDVKKLCDAKMKCNQDDIDYFMYLLYKEKHIPFNMFFGDILQQRKYECARLLARKEVDYDQKEFLCELDSKVAHIEYHLSNAKFYLKKRLEIIKNRERTYVEMEE